jgi:hypothetical protein
MTTRKKQNSTLFPTLFQHQNVENPSNPRTTPQHQQNPKSEKNTIAIVKCKSTTKNVAPNADLSYKKPPMAAGPWPSLRVLDRRLDKAFDSPEATRAFEVLRKKMEKDYAVKQLKKTRDNHMYFDDTDNYVSAEDVRSKYKKICQSKEYVKARKSLLSE